MTPKKSSNHKRSVSGKCSIDACTSRQNALAWFDHMYFHALTIQDTFGGYRLPSSGCLRQEWLSALKIEPSMKPSSKLIICARHFAPDAFQSSEQSNGIGHLMLCDEAVPSMFLWTKKLGEHFLAISPSPSTETTAERVTSSQIQNEDNDGSVTILSSDEGTSVAPTPEKRKRKQTSNCHSKKNSKRKKCHSSSSESLTDEEEVPQTLVCKDEDDINSDDSDVILCEKPVDTVDLTASPNPDSGKEEPPNFGSDEDGGDSDCQIIEEVIILNSDDENDEITYPMPLTPAELESEKYSNDSRDGSIPEGTGFEKDVDSGSGSIPSSTSSQSSSTNSPTSATPYASLRMNFQWDLNEENGCVSQSSDGSRTIDVDQSTTPPDDITTISTDDNLTIVESSKESEWNFNSLVQLKGSGVVRLKRCIDGDTTTYTDQRSTLQASEVVNNKTDLGNGADSELLASTVAASIGGNGLDGENLGDNDEASVASRVTKSNGCCSASPDNSEQNAENRLEDRGVENAELSVNLMQENNPIFAVTGDIKDVPVDQGEGAPQSSSSLSSSSSCRTAACCNSEIESAFVASLFNKTEDVEPTAPSKNIPPGNPNMDSVDLFGILHPNVDTDAPVTQVNLLDQSSVNESNSNISNNEQVLDDTIIQDVFLHFPPSSTNL